MSSEINKLILDYYGKDHLCITQCISDALPMQNLVTCGCELLINLKSSYVKAHWHGYLMKLLIINRYDVT